MMAGPSTQRAADWRQTYLDRFYDRSSGWVDGTTEFHALCAAQLPTARGTILEIGAGPSNATSRFLATLGTVRGLDTDDAVRTNDALASAEVFDGAGPFPFPDESFDLCVSNFVVEHVGDPRSHLREVKRVLRPGGAYVFRTPNRWHYTALVAAATPHWFHRLVANRLRALPEDAHDPYPTVYAMNTRASVRRFAAQAGLRVDALRMVEKDPSYGMFAKPLFLAFTAYERVVNRFDALADIRANIFAVLRKPGR